MQQFKLKSPENIVSCDIKYVGKPVDFLCMVEM